MPQSINFDPVAHRYDATRGYSPVVAGRIADGLMRAGGLSAGSTALEIGIGTGRIALPLLARGVDMSGVDISTRMVERLRAKYDVERAAEPERDWGELQVQLADMTTLPFADGAFDAVIAVHVLHLVPEWRAALTDALRVVRPGGAFLLGQDTHLTHDVRWDLQTRWTTLAAELGYTPRHVGAAGFDVVVDELERRGQPYEIVELARWSSEATPREVLTWIAEREWSRTWNMPDDLFAESIRQLTAWAEQHYAGTMETPRTMPAAFKVARVPKA